MLATGWCFPSPARLVRGTVITQVTAQRQDREKRVTQNHEELKKIEELDKGIALHVGNVTKRLNTLNFPELHGRAFITNG